MPRTGRPRRALPRTPTEAAAELRRFGLHPEALPLGVFLSLNDVVTVLDRLRKRGRAAVDVAQEPTVSDSTGTPEPDRRAVLVLDANGLRLEPADATDSDLDPAADLPWGADDPNPPVPTGDADEVPDAR